jgi:two-component system sensor histidine kinase RegB
MSAVPTDDRLSRGKLSHVRQGSVRWTPQPAGLTVPLETTDQPSPLRQHLRTLLLLRAVAAIVQLAVVWATVQILDVGLPLLPQLSLLAALLVLVAALALRLRFARPVTENEFFAHLLCDLAWLSFALYWAGGTLHNPFADLYIVYVGLAALTLRWRHVVATFLLALTAYALLRIHHVAPNAQSASLPIDELEAVAHASHFVLLASIVAYFGYRLSAAGRRYFEWLARARAREARDDMALNLATLAAGAAHELGTPLTTMAVLVGDMRRGSCTADEMRTNLEVMSRAIQACKDSLGDIVATAGAQHMNDRHELRAVDFVREAIDRFRRMRPTVPISVDIGCNEQTMVMTGATLRQSLITLLGNAADASPGSVGLRLRCTPEQLVIEVLDRGAGIPDEVRARLGEGRITTKSAHGLGLGVFLASLAIERAGGSLTFHDRDGGGTCARITLPTNTR